MIILIIISRNCGSR